MKRENGRVVIDIPEDDYDWLMMCLGAAAACSALQNMAVKLANAINEGNPRGIE